MYKCSEHGEWMTLRRMIVRHARGQQRIVQYWACPVRNCAQKKPHKYQRRKVG
jgi:hypothetical protein